MAAIFQTSHSSCCIPGRPHYPQRTCKVGGLVKTPKAVEVELLCLPSTARLRTNDDRYLVGEDELEYLIQRVRSLTPRSSVGTWLSLGTSLLRKRRFISQLEEAVHLGFFRDLGLKRHSDRLSLDSKELHGERNIYGSPWLS